MFARVGSQNFRNEFKTRPQHLFPQAGSDGKGRQHSESNNLWVTLRSRAGDTEVSQELLRPCGTQQPQGLLFAPSQIRIWV